MRKYSIGMMVVMTTSVLGIKTAFAQTKSLELFGYMEKNYSYPVQKPNGSFVAWYEDGGSTMMKATLVIDEAKKEFRISWLNGDKWTCRVKTREIKNENSAEVTFYNGNWSDDNRDCSLGIQKTTSSGCITVLRSGKVIDKEHGIDAWKVIMTVLALGKCPE